MLLVAIRDGQVIIETVLVSEGIEFSCHIEQFCRVCVIHSLQAKAMKSWRKLRNIWYLLSWTTVCLAMKNDTRGAVPGTQWRLQQVRRQSHKPAPFLQCKHTSPGCCTPIQPQSFKPFRFGFVLGPRITVGDVLRLVSNARIGHNGNEGWPMGDT